MAKLIWFFLFLTFHPITTCFKPSSVRYQAKSQLEKELFDYILKEEKNLDLEYILRRIAPDDATLVEDALHKINSVIPTPSHGNLGGVIECDLCLKVAPLVDYFLDKPKLQDFLYVLLGGICILGDVFSSRVCVLGIQEWGPIVLYLANNYVATTDEICGFVAGTDCIQPTIKAPTWNLTFPVMPRPPYVPPTSPPEGSDLAKVLHLTDIHMDMAYSENSNAHCQDPICCRDIDGEPISYYYAAGKYGSLAYCDSPLASLEDLFSKLSQESFDWVIITGDLPAHDVYNQTQADNIRVTKEVNGLLRKYFANATVLQALGNHESCPVDLYIPDYMDPDKNPNPMSWLYEVIVDEWSTWLPNSTFDTIMKGGFWAWEFTPGLKMISINAAFGQTDDWFSIVNNTDFNGMLQWMIYELQDCEDRGIKAWIISHHRCFGLPYYTNQVDRILQRYVGVISGWFNGHTHEDQFSLIFDGSMGGGTPVITEYTAPSVTTYHQNNMGYRVYYVDAKRENSTFFVADHETFYLNVTKAKKSGKPEWELEYRMKAAYNMSGLLPTDFEEMLARMATTPQLAENYLYFKYKSSQEVSCEASCAQSVASEMQRALDPSTDGYGIKNFLDPHAGKTIGDL